MCQQANSQFGQPVKTLITVLQLTPQKLCADYICGQIFSFMTKTILAYLLLFVGFQTLAQNKVLTLEDALVANRGSLAVKNLR